MLHLFKNITNLALHLRIYEKFLLVLEKKAWAYFSAIPFGKASNYISFYTVRHVFFSLFSQVLRPKTQRNSRTASTPRKTSYKARPEESAFIKLCRNDNLVFKMKPKLSFTLSKNWTAALQTSQSHPFFSAFQTRRSFLCRHAKTSSDFNSVDLGLHRRPEDLHLNLFSSFKGSWPLQDFSSKPPRHIEALQHECYNTLGFFDSCLEKKRSKSKWI